ncbi:hypothetical protein ACFQZ4_07745 [Catellatospora coxensis]
MTTTDFLVLPHAPTAPPSCSPRRPGGVAWPSSSCPDRWCRTGCATPQAGAGTCTAGPSSPARSRPTSALACSNRMTTG